MLLKSLFNKWIHFESTAHFTKIVSEIKTLNDYDSVIQVYMELYRKYDHAQKRYLLVKLLDDLLLCFSSDIGNLVIENLMEIVELTRSSKMPKDWSTKLQEFIFESLEKWAKEYPQYRAFKIAYQQILDSHDGNSFRSTRAKRECFVIAFFITASKLS